MLISSLDFPVICWAAIWRLRMKECKQTWQAITISLWRVFVYDSHLRLLAFMLKSRVLICSLCFLERKCVPAYKWHLSAGSNFCSCQSVFTSCCLVNVFCVLGCTPFFWHRIRTPCFQFWPCSLPVNLDDQSSATFFGDDRPFRSNVKIRERSLEIAHSLKQATSHSFVMPDLSQSHICIAARRAETKSRRSCLASLCLIKTDSGWRNDWMQWDIHWAHRGVWNIMTMMNSVCTVATVLTCLCGREIYSLLQFL